MDLPPAAAVAAAAAAARGLQPSLQPSAALSAPAFCVDGSHAAAGPATGRPPQSAPPPDRPWQDIYINPPLDSARVTLTAGVAAPRWPSTYLASVLPTAEGPPPEESGSLWDAWRAVEPAVAARARRHVAQTLPPAALT